MSNMNSRMNKLARNYLTEKWGAYCRGCQVLESEKNLVVDHKDNNDSNNNYNNWQYLCYSCNYIKNPRLSEREPLDMCGGVSECYSLDRETEITINREKEPKIREYVELRVLEEEQVPQQDLINSSAEMFSCSQKTTRRYLEKLTSSEGKFGIKKEGNITMIYLKEESKLK
ncbi:MAG: hypothetical protein O3C48_08420 [Crenarchaeota archaeon]|nr:hypothetical protein [Thermoproteota archaeon]